jgi:hypothetical protein
MKPKYNLELFYMAIFLSSEDWIHGLKALTDVQEFGLQTALGQNRGLRLGSMVQKEALLFSG